MFQWRSAEVRAGAWMERSEVEQRGWVAAVSSEFMDGLLLSFYFFFFLFFCFLWNLVDFLAVRVVPDLMVEVAAVTAMRWFSGGGQVDLCSDWKFAITVVPLLKRMTDGEVDGR